MSSDTTTTAPPADQAAVAAVPGRIVAAWAAQDADAFAAVFTEEGTMVLPGHYQKGRAAIREFMAAGFAGPYRGSRVTGTPLAVTFLNEGAAVVVTEGGVIPAGADTLPDTAAIRASWVVVKTDGDWLLGAYQNSPRDAG